MDLGPDLDGRDLEAVNEMCDPIEPNVMGFTDEEGVMHEVHLPKGTFKAASLHFLNANWKELKTFPKWGESLPWHLHKERS